MKCIYLLKCVYLEPFVDMPTCLQPLKKLVCLVTFCVDDWSTSRGTAMICNFIQRCCAIGQISIYICFEKVLILEAGHDDDMKILMHFGDHSHCTAWLHFAWLYFFCLIVYQSLTQSYSLCYFFSSQKTYSLAWCLWNTMFCKAIPLFVHVIYFYVLI